ncbi:L-rhamnose mutarotase [Planctomycetota bacterium]
MKRFGQVIGIKPEKLEEYKKLHAEVWPDVLKLIKNCNMRNYTIFQKDNFLFAYFEYVGNDFEADMAKMDADETTKKWWAKCSPCQVPLETKKENEWWANMQEVFHCD